MAKKKTPIPWVEIRLSYETRQDVPSYRALAREYSVNPSSIYRRARKENWVRGRIQHAHDVHTEARKLVEKDDAVTLSKINVAFNDIFNGLLKKMKSTEPANFEGMVNALCRVIKTLNDISPIPAGTAENKERWIKFITKLHEVDKGLYEDFYSLIKEQENERGADNGKNKSGSRPNKRA